MNAPRRSLKSAQRSLGWKSIVLLPLVVRRTSPTEVGCVYRVRGAHDAPPRDGGRAAREPLRRSYAAHMTGERPAASYRAAGVDYDALDAAKRLAIAQARATSPLLLARGARAREDSRGQPAFVFELEGRLLALVVEGLGTKSIIARQVLETQGIDRFAEIAYDAVAAIVNDLCCVGALPLVTSAYFATGSSDWYRDPDR